MWFLSLLNSRWRVRRGILGIFPRILLLFWFHSICLVHIDFWGGISWNNKWEMVAMVPRERPSHHVTNWQNMDTQIECWTSIWWAQSALWAIELTNKIPGIEFCNMLESLRKGKKQFPSLRSWAVCCNKNKQILSQLKHSAGPQSQ